MKRFLRNMTLAIIIGVALRAYFYKADHFDLFVYPNKDALETSQMMGTFDSADAARSVASDWIERHPNGDYEIAKNKKRMMGDVGIYEETFK